MTHTTFYRHVGACDINLVRTLSRDREKPRLAGTPHVPCAIPADGATNCGVPIQFRDPPLADGLGLRELGEVTLDVSGTEMRRVFKGCEK